jgi:predicted Rossmann fold nucleotide-binding protein DprA/Smf involved in DNA uptake
MGKVPLLAVRVKILSLLGSIPMNSAGMSQRIGCPIEDVESQLLYLEIQGKVERLRSEKYKEIFWKLKK